MASKSKLLSTYNSLLTGNDSAKIISPGTTVDKFHPLPRIVRRALIKEYHPRGRKPMDPVVTEELLRRGDNLECMPPLHLFDTQPCIEEFSLKDLRVTRYMMEDAGIDTEKIAASMGEAFAILHFKCEALGHACFALGASPAYEAWKFGPLEIRIHILYLNELLEAKEMSVEAISTCSDELIGVIPAPPECDDTLGDPIWHSFRTAYIIRQRMSR
ncbi:hypothetical protein FPHYL_2124 [Fusarium phyllophilum]|uniref:Uncharacterized protein n=1 Tax=Fusarium phyllophilum TaxID=47803 RepID=A0A8H5K7T7_9HYPO|nr:hypothetical protein FPHYL_2124 [Fusarium phyllophilum]